jgi:O-antigen/teichoic acid export membrane protein
MTGHEKVMRNISLFYGVVGMLLYYVLIDRYGLMGASYAFAFVILLQNFTVSIFVLKRLGIWVLPFPDFKKGLS